MTAMDILSPGTSAGNFAPCRAGGLAGNHAYRFERIDQLPLLPSALAIAVMVFQLRVVTGTPKSRSNVPR